jgi:hypothetical protein
LVFKFNLIIIYFYFYFKNQYLAIFKYIQKHQKL